MLLVAEEEGQLEQLGLGHPVPKDGERQGHPLHRADEHASATSRSPPSCALGNT
jgi:hypothetical protein